MGSGVVVGGEVVGGGVVLGGSKQIRDRGSPWFVLVKLQLEKDTCCPWQMIWFRIHLLLKGCK